MLGQIVRIAQLIFGFIVALPTILASIKASWKIIKFWGKDADSSNGGTDNP